jgi:hypothetical protein
VAFPSASILDGFDRANGAIGANYSPIFSFTSQSFNVSASLCAPDNTTGDTWESAYWDTTRFGPNCECYLTVTTLHNLSTTYHQLAVRMTTPGVDTWDGYLVELEESACVITVYRVDNEAPTQLGATVAYSPTNGYKLGAEASGSIISAYTSTGTWAQSASRADNTYSASGYIGFTMYEFGAGGTLRYNDFGGGTIVTGSVPSASYFQPPRSMHQFRMRRI